MGQNKCYHCGDDCNHSAVFFDEKNFCCHGCKTVYEIFSENDLSYYYDLETAAGTSPKEIENKYDFLEEEKILKQLLEFNEEGMQIINLYIPVIHCSSCIWILENLHRLNPSVVNSQVDFPKKTVRITYKTPETNLKAIVSLLAKIGYEPNISLEQLNQKKTSVDRSLVYQLGIAGFAFGNVMFLSFPEYFHLPTNGHGNPEFWLEKYKTLFRWLMFAFSVPVVFYSGKSYLISAYKGLRSKILNIDVPIALGILVLFVRSTAEIILDTGSGFFDSLTGLVFFLLLGKFFQQKTYAFLSFERDYKSYFPIAVTRIKKNKKEEHISLNKIKKGDVLLIRNEELIPVDCILIKGLAQIDYSFVTGEVHPVQKYSGDTLYAGGKQLNGAIEVEAIKSVSQSYLTQLWSNAAFKKNKSSNYYALTDRVSKHFTIVIISIAFLASIFWMWADSSKVLNVFTSVLIIACPCALALAAPFTLGNMIRAFGKKKFYLKDTSAIERLANVDTIIFDKTGTLTSTKNSTVHYEGICLTPSEESLLKNTLRASNHPLSRILYQVLKEHDIVTLDSYDEHLGQGICGVVAKNNIKIGSGSYVNSPIPTAQNNTTVHISSNEQYKGCFVIHNEYREGVSQLFDSLEKEYGIALLSGDNEGEKPVLENMLPPLTPLLFNQKPKDKLTYIKQLQQKGKVVLMVGDGLNDAGALAQSDVGIALSENVNVFSPACDGILDASKLKELHQYIKASKKAIHIIRTSFLLSLLYNLIGLYFAVTGSLQPVVAAILMPLSSISIVVFTTIYTSIVSKHLK